jgi:hypothetical protein
MDVRHLGFGSIEVDGRAYEHDIVIDRGVVRKRSKKPSKKYRDKFGHTHSRPMRSFRGADPG